MAACPNCGEANPAHARFCHACGAALAAESVARETRETRRTVTIVFCDVTGSTSLGERLDAEPYRHVIARYFIEASLVLERHGGTVEKFIGDAVMAVFGIPTLHEDDALRAVRAAGELREALGSLNEELQREFGVELGVRTGIDTGEVVAGDPSEGQAFATGEAVVVAQRLQSVARPGEILMGDATHRLVRDAVLVEPVEPLSLKGKAQPTRAWRLLGVVAGAPAFARRLDAAMVGRKHEFAKLREAFDEAVRERACRLVTIVGPAGIGKSRLANELLASVEDEASPLLGRCLPYGEGITYWPLRDVVRNAAGDLTEARIRALVDGEDDADRIAARVAGAIGVSEAAGAPEETQWAVRRLFEQLARERPLIVGLDDLQWAEPTFLDLVEYVVGWISDAPVLMLCLARPELLDRRPAWFASSPHSQSIELGPLSEPDAEALLDVLRGEAEVDPEVLGRIKQAAEGNPLFVEQMLAMMIEDEGATVEVSIPPSIHALLAARLDRLEPEQRAVLERASVIGREFWRGAVIELSPEEEQIGAHLMTLVRKELIRPHSSIFPEEDAFRFRHILIRDAAYLGLPKEARAELHELYAGWLERTADSALDEILGYHLEQAFRYRQEVGRVDATAQALATQAGERLAAAGRRAHARGDLPASVSLLTRAAALLPDDHGVRREVLPELASALMRLGDFQRADSVLTEAMAAASAAGDRRLVLRTRIDREFFREFTKPEGSIEEILAVADETIPLLEELGDDLGLAKAWWLKSEVYVMACRWGARAMALERALDHARRAGDRREESTITALLVQALHYGPTPVPTAISRCEEFLEGARDDRSLEAAMARTLAALKAMQGDFDEARGLWRRASGIYEELALNVRRVAGSLVAAEIELLAGNPAEAAALLQSGYETADEMGIKSLGSTIAAFLADALCEQGNYAEAERFSAISEDMSASADLVTQIVWRIARAKALARRKETESAEQLAREALVMADDTDFLALQGSTLVALAEVLASSGQTDEANALHERARDVYERKGNVVAAGRVAHLIADAAPSAP
jgi:predicted ATPase/class 3 adenylate cyclase